MAIPSAATNAVALRTAKLRESPITITTQVARKSAISGHM